MGQLKHTQKKNKKTNFSGKTNCIYYSITITLFYHEIEHFNDKLRKYRYYLVE